MLREELGELLLARAQLFRRLLLLDGREVDGALGEAVAQLLVGVLQLLRQLLDDELRAIGLRVGELDAKRVAATRLELHGRAQLVDLHVDIGLGGIRVGRRITDDLLELRTRDEQLAVLVRDVLLRDLLAVRREHVRRDALLVEQRRPRLVRARLHHRERERQAAAEEREDRDEPPIAQRLPAEIGQALQTIAWCYCCDRHRRNDGTRARMAPRASREPTWSPANPGRWPRTGRPRRDTSSIS